MSMPVLLRSGCSTRRCLELQYSGWLVGLCLLLVACGGEEVPAKPERAASNPAPKSAQAPQATWHPYTLRPGETLWAIARRHHIPLARLLAHNHLTEAKARRLRDGMRIEVPASKPKATHASQAKAEPSLPPAPPAEGRGAHHTLQEGETLWALAQLYDTTPDAIMQANGLNEDHVRLLRPGRAVLIPGIKATQIRRAPVAKARKVTGVRHRLEPGETVWDLARRFDVSVSSIMAVNALEPDEVQLLREGSFVRIPGVTRDRKGAVRKQPVGRAQQRANARGRRLGLGTRKAAGALLRGQVKPRWARAAGGRASRLLGTLRWPVTRGWITRGYGSGRGGYHRAVDIMGKIGWNVRSAGPGIVGYAGRGVRGYGNMVLVIHPGGWVTMYAHNSVNFVVAGQKVSRGQILAEVGSTGISKGPHVHFEFIYAGKNCDPAPLFRPGVRHRDGRRAKVRQALWRHPDKRPKGLRCLPRKRFPHTHSVEHERAEDV
ncbi:MAG: LysM peptidoglycan-binding domain-containing protein [Polyangiales bacterium]